MVSISTKGKSPANWLFLKHIIDNFFSLESRVEKNDYLSICTEATNCEVYVDGDYTRIRFIEGTEPGTSNYTETVGITDTESTPSQNSTLGKRQSGSLFTYIAAARNTINYGTQNPGDIIHSPMWDNCGESACRPADVWQYSNFVGGAPQGYGGTMLASRGLLVRSGGKYPGWDYRNRLAESIKQISYKGQKWNRKDWSWSRWEAGGISGTWYHGSGTAWEGTQSDYMSVSIYWEAGVVKTLVGFIDVYVMYAPDKVDEACGRVYDLLSAASGTINGIGGLIFGLLKLSCA